MGSWRLILQLWTPLGATEEAHSRFEEAHSVVLETYFRGLEDDQCKAMGAQF